MTDRSIEAEIKANNRRKEAERDDDDGTLVDVVENAVAPFTDAIKRSGDEDDKELREERREGNDADQRSS